MVHTLSYFLPGCWSRELEIFFNLWQPKLDGHRCSVIKLCLTLCDPHGLQHARLPCPSLFPWICSNSCPLSWWCLPTISSCVTPFSFPQSFPASESFPMNWLFASGGQSIGTSASPSVLPVTIQGWFPLGLTGLISSLSRDSQDILK